MRLQNYIFAPNIKTCYSLKNIKNIIFDLGGVIINIYPHKTYEAFNMPANDSAKMSVYLHDLFHQLEIGAIDTTDFITEAKKEWELPLTKQEICDGLNAMLGDIPSERIRAIENVKGKYNIFLLSNTNAIHYEGVMSRLEYSTQWTSFEHLFHKTYYSHLVGLRKPDPAIYQLVLDENELVPDETLFLDDLGENLKSAQSLGIRTIKVSERNSIVDILNDF